MTKFSLLVADDELDEPYQTTGVTRRQYYDELKKNFDIQYASDPDDFIRRLNTTPVNAVVIDFVLTNWGLTDPRVLLSLVDDRVPVVLISSRWGPVFNLLRETLAAYKTKVCQLFTWEDLLSRERRANVELWLQLTIRERGGLALVDPPGEEPIRILQLSDIHFGTKEPEDFETETELTAQAIKLRWGGPPHFIALTGDVTAAGLPEHFELASAWVSKLTSRLDVNWSNDRILMIPGNHDVCWPLGLSGRVEIPKEEDGVRKARIRGEGPVNTRLQQFALEPYRKFAKSLGLERQWSGNNNYWTDGRYRNHGLLFFGYNSCEELDQWCVPTKKLVDKTISSMITELESFQNDVHDSIVVGLIHHPLVGAMTKEVIVNRDLFVKNMARLKGDVVILSGHTHQGRTELTQGDEYSFLQVIASTATLDEAARPSSTLRGFNMIQLDRQNSRVAGITIDECEYRPLRIDVTRRLEYSRSPNGLLQRRIKPPSDAGG